MRGGSGIRVRQAWHRQKGCWNKRYCKVAPKGISTNVFCSKQHFTSAPVSAFRRSQQVFMIASKESGVQQFHPRPLYRTMYRITAHSIHDVILYVMWRGFTRKCQVMLCYAASSNYTITVMCDSIQSNMM